MKKTYLFFTTILLSITTVFCQTTQEEYDYLTNGYAKQAENGLDIYKKGYELIPMATYGQGTGYTFDYFAFKETETENLKGILIVATKDKNNKKKYLCLPIKNPDLMYQFNIDYDSLGVSMQPVATMSSFFMLSESLYRIFDLKKNQEEKDTTKSN